MSVVGFTLTTPAEPSSAQHATADVTIALVHTAPSPHAPLQIGHNVASGNRHRADNAPNRPVDRSGNTTECTRTPTHHAAMAHTARGAESKPGVTGGNSRRRVRTVAVMMGGMHEGPAT